jgi:uncharacterized protein (TIGR02145 family)
MKEVGTTKWNSPNTDATNTSLFTGLPGGYHYDGGDYSNIGDYGYWWSSTEYSTNGAWYRFLYYINGAAGRIDSSKKNRFSVRCLRD